jgi:hypothetical protein
MLVATRMDPSKRKPNTYSGWFKFSALPKAAVYQITLSQAAWVDFVQDGKLVQTNEHQCIRRCPSIQKAIRYNGTAASTIIQIVGAKNNVIKLTVHEGQ